MKWHYVNAGQSVGPLSDAEFSNLVQTGGIQPDTLVWNETMAGWQPYSQIKMVVAAPSGLAGAAPVSSATAASAIPSQISFQTCSQCGKAMPPENLIPLGGLLVCAACKPAYVQKMREGLPVLAASGEMEYAGVGTRLAAKILDGLILGLGAAVVIGLAAGLLIPLIGKDPNGAPGLVILLVLIVGVVLFGVWFYQIWCLPKYGGTPGKRIMNIKVVTADGGPISWGRSIGRWFGEMLNGLIPFAIGYIIAIFDAQKRTVHDHIAGTRVVKR